MRLGRKMWCSWPAQIKPHQVSYEAVSPPTIERFHSAEDMSFPTIRTRTDYWDTVVLVAIPNQASLCLL